MMLTINLLDNADPVKHEVVENTLGNRETKKRRDRLISPLSTCSTAWTKLEQFNGEQVARFFQVITFPQRELCARYSTMNSN